MRVYIIPQLLRYFFAFTNTNVIVTRYPDTVVILRKVGCIIVSTTESEDMVVNRDVLNFSLNYDVVFLLLFFWQIAAIFILSNDMVLNSM